MVERSLCMREVRGSIPRISIIQFLMNFFACWAGISPDGLFLMWQLSEKQIDFIILDSC